MQITILLNHAIGGSKYMQEKHYSIKSYISRKNVNKARHLKEDNWQRNLWKAVLCQAIEDATTKSLQKRKQYYRKRAIQWLIEDNDDFKEVCDFAGYCYKSVIKTVRMIVQDEMERKNKE